LRGDTSSRRCHVEREHRCTALATSVSFEFATVRRSAQRARRSAQAAPVNARVRVGNTRCRTVAVMSMRFSTLRVGASTSLVLVALLLGSARGDPAPVPDTTGAPLPGEESGQTWNAEGQARPSAPWTFARGLLAVPRAIAYVLFLPVRGILVVFDRYDLENRYYATFYNASRTFGIHPAIEYGTGFGLMFGARLISTDTFGGQENLTVMGAYGGTYQEVAEAWLDSGNRLGPVVVKVGGNFDRFARLPFYGIGNNGDRTLAQPMLIDPLTEDTAVRSYYRYQEARAAVYADLHVLDGVHVIGHGAYTDLSFQGSTKFPAIDTIYNPMDLVGFMPGVKHLYGQLELRVDERHVAQPPWENVQYSTGWLASGFLGGVEGLDQAHNFGHYGVDLQSFIHLGLGPRMLWLRFWGEGVTGDTNEVPFVELPYLGGDFLRGYPFARFRDRVAGLGTAQYIWDVQRDVTAYLFVDAGRVYGSLNDVTYHGMRVGYGGGFALHSSKDFVAAASLASSIDGGLFLTATLTPYWDEVPRWR
jgi:hypothetical protein